MPTPSKMGTYYLTPGICGHDVVQAGNARNVILQMFT